jgi:outer membrane receptor protein involved in Fe transport
MAAPALRAGAASRWRPAPKGRWPPPKKKVYNGKWYYTAYRNEIPTPSYVLVNGGLRLRRHVWMLTLGVTNLLNARYQSHLSIFRQWGREGIWAPGRSFYVRMEDHL